MMDHAKNILVRSLSKFSNSRHAAMYTFLIGFISSVLVSSFIRISPLVSVLVLTVAVAVYATERVWNGEVLRDIALVVILFAALGLGALRYAIKDFHETTTPVATGIVASEPEHRDADTRFIFQSDNGERVLVSTDLASRVEYGDRVEVEGRLKVPGVIVDDTSGREFDYGAYLAKDDIYYTESFAKVKKLDEGSLIANSPTPDGEQAKSSRIISALLKVKNSFVGKIKSILPEPEASLLAGLIVAGKEALPGNVLDDFKRAGVVHIVVLSGYNVTIIAEFFLFVFAFLGLRRAAAASAIAIVLFTLMTGATATVVRAAIMVIALLAGKIIGRPYHPGRILLATAFLMIVWNPKVLVFDPSFQLSFLAMIALVYVTPLVEKLLRKVPGKFGFREMLSVTLATQITVLPYLMYSVGNISVVSIFTNILILVFVPYTMLIGFAATLLAYLSPIIAWPLAFVVHALLRYVLGVAHFFGSLSFASIHINHVSVWCIVLLYILLGTIVVRVRSLLQPQTN
jgi:competence protein ComEC